MSILKNQLLDQIKYNTVANEIKRLLFAYSFQDQCTIINQVYSDVVQQYNTNPELPELTLNDDSITEI